MDASLSIFRAAGASCSTSAPTLVPTAPCAPPQVSEHPECRVRLTIQEGSSGRGKAAGHKVKLMAALVLAGTSTEGLSKPGRLASIASR